MQGFLNILKTEPSIKDGTLDFKKVRKLSHSNGTSNGVSNGTAQADCGVHLKFNNVKFGYTPDRTVRASHKDLSNEIEILGVEGT